MVEREEEIQAGWNLSQSLIIQIGSLLQSSSTNFRGGRIQNSFFDSEEIRTLITTFLSKDEEKELDDLGDRICKLNSIWIGLQRKYENQLALNEENTIVQKGMSKMGRAKTLHAKHIKKYRRLIMDALSRTGFGMATKEDSSRMF